MAKQNSNASEQLQELITERQRYEDWLSALEARRQSAPAHVYARVAEDYGERLARVRKELAERASELKERIDGLAERLVATERDEGVRRDAKAEAELRAAVGEYTADKWSSMAAEADREIATLVGQRQLLERELSDLQQILEQSTGAAPPATVAVAPADATRTEKVAAKPAAASGANGLVERVKLTPPGGVYISKSGEVVEKQPIAERESPFAASSGGGASMKAAAARSSSGTAVATPPAGLSLSAVSAPTSTAEPARQPPPVERRTDGEKTLKCSECATMNYSTEWYCESCGAELSAL